MESRRQFLDFIKTSPAVKKISTGLLEFDSKIVFRTSITFICPYTKQEIVGCGRSEYIEESIIKAAMECIERLTLLAFKENRCSPEQVLTTNSYSVLQDPDLSYNSVERIEYPPSDLITSNGWATHFSRKESLKNAFCEFVERHLITRAFLFKDAEKFHFLQSNRLNEYLIDTFATIENVQGIKALISIIKSKRHPGYSLGYRAVSVSDDFTLAKEHCALEAIEPILVYDNFDEESILLLEQKTGDFLFSKQISNIINKKSSIDAIRESAVEVRPQEQDIKIGKIHISQFNSSLLCGFEGKLFTTFVFCDSGFPLWDPNNLNEKSRIFLQKIFSENGFLDENIDYEIPVF